jgi:phage tail sheath protein FI
MSKAQLASKIIVGEETAVIRSVPALRTAVWAVFGVTERGPHTTTLIQSYEEYVRYFGGYTTDAKDVPAAVEGFFANGGEFCYVTRIVHYSSITDKTSLTSTAATVTLVDREDPTDDTLSVTAKTHGTWGNDLRVQITNATSGSATEFNLVLKNSVGVVLETWANLSMSSTADNYALTVVNRENTGSNRIVLADLASGSTPPDNMPAIISSASLTGGGNGLTDLADTDFIGSEAGDTGLYRTGEISDITLISIPGRTATAVANGILTFLLNRDDLYTLAILDPPANTSASGMVTYVKSTASIYNLDERLSIFWPRIKVTNPNKTVYGAAETITVPPCGHVAGVMARTDNSRPGGVYLQPAGVERGTIRGARGLEMTEVTNEKKRDIVYPANVNPITTLSGYPIHIDGHRTLKTNGNFPSIGERRGVFFIEASLKEAVIFAKHSNNDSGLRSSVERTCEQFLIGQMNVGAFRTKNPETAFFVDCGEGLNPLSEQRAGRLNVRVGLATQSAVDWVYLSFSRDDSAGIAAEAAAAQSGQ